MADTSHTIQSPHPKNRAGKRRRAPLAPYAFITPAYLIFIAFLLGPMIFAVILSLFRWTALRPPRFVAFANYQYLLGDSVFWQAVKNTLLYSGASLFIVCPLALLLALALNSPALRFKPLWRAIYFAPIVTSAVAISLTFLMLYNREFGLINAALAQIGIGPFNWLGDRRLAPWAVIGVIIWRWTGLTSIYFLAGLQSIPRDLYDAAAIDGANTLQRFWHITLPQLRPVTLFVSVIVLIGSMQIFDEPQILTNGGPANATLSVVQYLYTRGIEQLRFGYASTIGFALFVGIFVLSLVQFRFFRQREPS